MLQFFKAIKSCSIKPINFKHTHFYSLFKKLPLLESSPARPKPLPTQMLQNQTNKHNLVCCVMIYHLIYF